MSVAAGEVLAGASPVPARRVSAGHVRGWLWGLALLVVLMVAIGGATRLTGSGLSITEWKPVTGAVPPLSDAGWSAEFEKYRASSQYRNLNRGMELPEFKSIYWWEWSHRQLGRLIGLYFFLPLAAFWMSGALASRLVLRLLGIGALGGLQAAVGWIMVASGLEPGMTAVAPVKLTLHLLIASAILALIVWTASGLGAGRAERAAPGAWRAPAVLLALILLQIGLGGLVAGSRAGWTYNTWPLMDGQLVPSAETLLVARPAVANLVENAALVQLNHRLTAYLLVAFALWHAVAVRRSAPGSRAAHRATGVAGLALMQMALGITTLVLVVPLAAGLAHQLLAMGLLVAATLHLRRSLDGSREPALSPARRS